MSCNEPLDARMHREFRVSIPIGFSNELQPTSSIDGTPISARVSIPIGFSNELQRSQEIPVTPARLCGFNPYRVFQ